MRLIPYDIVIGPNTGLRLRLLRFLLRLRLGDYCYCRHVIGQTKGTLVLTFLGSEEEEIVVPTIIQHLIIIISGPR